MEEKAKTMKGGQKKNDSAGRKANKGDGLETKGEPRNTKKKERKSEKNTTPTNIP